MAGDLVERLDIRHTFAHDIESFFWVLLWIVLTRVQTFYSDAARSNFIHQTMNPKVCCGSGGSTKTTFLVSPRMLEESVDDFRLPNNPSLCALLVEMKGTVADRYLNMPSKKESSSKPELVKKIDRVSIALKCDNVTESDESHKALRAAANDSKSMNRPLMLGLMKNHRVVVGLFDTALSAPWPSDDKAAFYPILPSSSAIGASCSGSKRSRSAIEIQLAEGDQPLSKRQALL